jgi:hypothetical protein
MGKIHTVRKTQVVKVEDLVLMAGNAAKVLGEAEAGLSLLKTSTEKAVEEQLIILRNAGFKVEFLDRKHPCRQAMEAQLRIAYVRGVSPEYAAYFDATKAKKETPEVPDKHWFESRGLSLINPETGKLVYEVPESTRLNRFSNIRKWFIENNGKKTVPLDLYGNKARKESAKKKKSTRGNTDPASKTAASSVEPAVPADPKAVTSSTKPNLKGVGPLRQFCEAWASENVGVAGLKSYVDAVQRLLQIIETNAPKK